ncbi:hypothetical protein ACIRU3_25870 [Streptomyces sp. NPDC101151]|uniref:hypothetical protein n=1 Tax=Streptomyces sp. NPDC101151 TaxID=3366115 RepID=UPI0038117675
MRGTQDRRTEAMAQIIAAQRGEREAAPPAPEPKQLPQVLDFMAALNASVREAKASRGEPASDADVPEPAKPRTKAATEKQPARKATKKTAARKPRHSA